MLIQHTPYDTSASDKCAVCSINSSKYSVKESSVSSEIFSNSTGVNSLCKRKGFFCVIHNLLSFASIFLLKGSKRIRTELNYKQIIVCCMCYFYARMCVCIYESSTRQIVLSVIYNIYTYTYVYFIYIHIYTFYVFNICM